ncbi:MAG: hypothetical protein JSS04_10155 [Proteobacteria bacterium]|nr:hypothetical protein [Pseudomonadota bacterium]
MIDFFIDGTGLLGILFLAILAVRGDRYAHWNARLTDASAKVGAEWKTVADQAKTKLNELQDGWKPWIRWVLVVGSFLGALSYILALVRDAMVYASRT